MYDSVKVAKKDTFTVPIVRTLRFADAYKVPVLDVYDSTNTQFYRYYEQYSRTSYPGYLGVVGQASYDIDFMNRKTFCQDLFLEPYSLTFLSYKDLDYYNTRRPFTKLSYVDGANEEGIFNVLHTQNVNKECNFGLEMRFLGAVGSYMYEKSSGRDIRAWVNYFGPRYSLVSQYSFNRLYTQENGGLYDLADVNNLQSILKESSMQLTINLSGASSKNRFTQFYAKQEFSLIPAYKKPDTIQLALNEFPLALGHEIIFDDAYRTYTETVTDNVLEFYPRLPHDTTETNDSSRYQMLDNMLYLKLTGNRRNGIATMLGFGVESEIHQFADYAGYDPMTFYQNSYVALKIWKKGNQKSGFDLSSRFFANGRKSQNYLADFTLFTTFDVLGEPSVAAVTAHADRQSPSYFFNTYSSNFYDWRYDFGNQMTNQVSIKVSSVKKKFEARLSASLIDNYMYFNQTLDPGNIYSSQDIAPTQEKDGLMVLSGLLSKKTHFWIVQLDNSVLWQQSSNTGVLSLPQLATFNTISFNIKLFKKKLLFRPGADVYTWTAFNLPGYSPELGVFYSQHETSYGKYPFVDAFLQFNFKRMQIFFKYANVSYHFTRSSALFSVHRYPQQTASFSFGLSWYFYN